MYIAVRNFNHVKHVKNPHFLGITSSVKSQYFDQLHGGVKMACSMLVVLVAVGIVFQFGSQTAMTAVLEASAFVKLPFQTINAYVNPSNDVSARQRRSPNHLPLLTSLELENSVSIAESFVAKMYTHEVNIADSGVKILPGTPAQGQLIDSQPSLVALQMNRDAMVAVKASKYIASKHCLRLRINDEECARQLSEIKLSPTSLGKKCPSGSNPAFCSGDLRFRSQDNACNHRSHPAWGMANTPYRRLLFPQYDDGLSTPRGSSRSHPLPSPRVISVGLTLDEDRPDRHSTLALMQWGQFVYNDVAHTVTSHMFNTGSTINCCTPEGLPVSPRHSHSACFPIEVPRKDPFYAKFGRTCMNYVRSVAAIRQDCTFGPVEQLNQATPVLDASMIYGTSDEVTATLRSFTAGKLLNNANFLPQSSTPETDCQVRDSPAGSVCYASGMSDFYRLNQATPVLDASMIYGTSDEVTATLRSFTAGKLLNNANFLPQSSTPETDCQVRDSPAGSVCYASGMSLKDTMAKSTIAKLKSLYKKVDDIDLIVGGIAEVAQDGAIVGPTFRCILAEQFIRTRAGDRFFYDNPGQPSSFTKPQLDEIRKVSLARVMCDNSDHISTMQKYVFLKPSTENKLLHCTSAQIPSINLDLWREEAGYLTVKPARS
ncbi:peroxidase-like [Diaphorina citri]|uniref:Peroxidase-like n=1 Tax=Diaphorina citri TaxID=121845 RepID=A0A3Q0IZM5_DIACI|nr:peroxidase-like [Diaphorina citri]